VVRSRLHQGKLNIYGWVYEIETGEVLAYDPHTQSFVAPYSQLSADEQGYSYQPGAYSHTLAPPVGNAKQTTAHQPQVQKAPNSWLSVEQAERIYRGSTARR
jgi:carbonic anhydrase